MFTSLVAQDALAMHITFYLSAFPFQHEFKILSFLYNTSLDRHLLPQVAKLPLVDELSAYCSDSTCQTPSQWQKQQDVFQRLVIRRTRPSWTWQTTTKPSHLVLRKRSRRHQDLIAIWPFVLLQTVFKQNSMHGRRIMETPASRPPIQLPASREVRVMELSSS